MTAPHACAPNFDRIARPYRWLEHLTFGRSLERCRLHFLPHLKHCRAALVFGDGDGRFLSRLLAQNALLGADAVDTSATMLRLLTRRAAASAPRAGDRLVTHHLSALHFVPTRTYDLVVTHFFLDCLTPVELTTLCTRITPHLTRQALWLVSDFRVADGPLRWPSRLLIRALYLGFRVLTGLHIRSLPNHKAALIAAGLTRIAIHRSLGGILTTELWRQPEYTSNMLPEQRPKPPIPDPVPDPEPASPSLPGPDPGVFHHELGVPKPDQPKSS